MSADRQRELARLRQQRRRARDRDGVRSALIEIDVALIEDALIQGGWLRAQDADNPRKFNQALAAAVPVWAQVEIAEDLVTRDNSTSRSVR